MATADAFRSSTTRPVNLRRRGDLDVTRQVYQGQAWWVVKDPIALHYFRFRPEEYALLDMLDGQRSLEQLKERFEAQFPPRRITVEELARFVSTLHRSGLVTGDRPGQGPQLFERRRQRIWRHGLSCKHYGGECHEMGMMLLVFTPCLYCDVSDSWMLPNKWKRAAIGAAGMYVELILASIATYLWWWSHPGIFNQLCLDVMFVSSVSTLLFNANPLLRYDGYYILSDIIEIPNLRQKASTILGRLASKWCLGIKQPEDPFLPQRNLGLFALYAVASSIYMWIVTASIFFFVWNVFKPYRLEVLGRLLAAGAIWGLVVRPAYGMIKFFKVPGRRDEVKSFNLAITLAIAATIRGGAHPAATAGVVRVRTAAPRRGDGLRQHSRPARPPVREDRGRGGRRTGDHPPLECRPGTPDRGAPGAGHAVPHEAREPPAGAVHRPERRA